MRVALVGPYPVDLTRVQGGVESSFSMLVSGLASLSGLDPYVITFRPALTEPHVTVAEGVTVEYVPGTRRLGNLTLRARERRSLRAILDRVRPDIVHAQDALGYGYVCLKTVQRAPVVVSVHGIVREQIRYLRSPSARIRGHTAGVSFERYCIRRARFLMTPTPYAKQYFGAEINGRIWDIGNPVSDRLFALQPAPEWGRMLFAGTLIPLKRVLDLVDVLPQVLLQVPDAHLRVAGGVGDPHYAAQVQARVRDLGLEDRVDLLGEIGTDALVEEYRRAALLVLPSSQETSPMVIGEAMAAGVPVVATRVGGVPYLVEHGVTGWTVEVGDLETLAQRLVDVLSDPARATALGAAGRAEADMRFRAPLIAAQVRAVYAEILASTI